MRNSLFVFALVILLGSCSKESEEVCCSQTLQQQDHWSIENFKPSYTIQLPAIYAGSGMMGFEGNTFFKRRTDNSVVLQYSYCSPLYCTDFGNALADKTPSSIDIIISSNVITLDRKETFCNGIEKVGIYYYNTDPEAYGRLYWKQDGKYVEALQVNYNASRHKEVVAILRTIKSK